MSQKIAREISPGTERVRVLQIPFSQIPHQSRLFLEYLSDPVSLQKVYPNAVVSPHDLKSYVPTVLENYRTDRDKLCNALADLNLRCGSGERTFQNIQILRDNDTVAVVTGQQAGLFTGPLYTIYKALSTVKLAEQLSNDGQKTVPIFWMATEDHDFDEVSKAVFIDKMSKLFNLKYVPKSYGKDSPVGRVEIDSSITGIIDRLFDELPNTEFSQEIHEIVSDSWSAGAGFGDAFAKMLAAICSKFGIILIDPLDGRIKDLSAPIYSAAIDRVDEIVPAVIERGLELEVQGYHTQVLVGPDYFPLFWHDGAGRRTALRKTGEGTYRAKGEKRGFTTAELRAAALSEPDRFSPGVMLRPVVQDYLLPTVCYFGGGAEIAYFAQNSEVYRILSRPVTPVFHRQSFTVVEAKHRRVLRKFNLDLAQMFEGLEKITLRLAANSFSPETARMFAEVEERINTEMNRIDRAVSEIDVTLAAIVAKRRRKMMYHIAALRKKTLMAEVRKDSIANRQIESLFASLVPNGELQERSVNVLTFLNKFGLNFIDWVYDAIDLEDKEHRIIEL